VGFLEVKKLRFFRSGYWFLNAVKYVLFTKDISYLWNLLRFFCDIRL